MMYKRLSVISEIDDLSFLSPSNGTLTGGRLQPPEGNEPADLGGNASNVALSYILTPVFDAYTEDANIVAFFFIVVPWSRYFRNVLPEDKNGFEVVINDSCGSVFTFVLNGPDAYMKSWGDTHESRYDGLGRGWVYQDSFRRKIPAEKYDPSTKGEGECVYELYVYPTDTLKSAYTSDDPIQYAVAVSLIFVFTALVFLAYDWAVARRQNKVLKTATRTQAIVASLFPENVQERILQEAENDAEHNTYTPRFRTNRTKDQLRSFLNDNEDEATGALSVLKSRPIADLFPEATVIFAE